MPAISWPPPEREGVKITQLFETLYRGAKQWLCFVSLLLFLFTHTMHQYFFQEMGRKKSSTRPAEWRRLDIQVGSFTLKNGAPLTIETVPTAVRSDNAPCHLNFSVYRAQTRHFSRLFSPRGITREASRDTCRHESQRVSLSLSDHSNPRINDRSGCCPISPFFLVI